MSYNDQSLKFIFEEADIRGEIVHLDRAFSEVNEIHQYAPGVSEQLGEFMAASVLLSTTIKFEGRLVLQAQSEGQLPLLMAECTNDLRVRAIARGAEQATASGFAQLLGGGTLAITIEPASGQRYQGIVPLSGQSLSECVEHYFDSSEQLPTKLWLAGGSDCSAGLLLQQLPSQRGQQHEETWLELCALAQTVTTEELLGTAPLELLHRLFHEHPLRVFDPETVRFACSCSRERCQKALVALGSAELEELFKEQSEVTMDCEFCNSQYVFVETDFAESGGGKALH